MIKLKLVFRSLKGRCRGSQFLLVHGCRWVQAANGVARWANVGLCNASSCFFFFTDHHSA